MMVWAKVKVAAVVLLVVAGIGVGSVVAALATAPTTKPVAGVAGTSVTVVKGTLKSGISAEILGITENPAEARNWWRPDGSPLPAGPYSRPGGDWTSDSAARVFGIPIRVAGPAGLTPELAEDAALPVTTFDPRDAAGKPMAGCARAWPCSRRGLFPARCACGSGRSPGTTRKCLAAAMQLHR